MEKYNTFDHQQLTNYRTILRPSKAVNGLKLQNSFSELLKDGTNIIPDLEKGEHIK
ncbi:hypothetical protein HYE28_01485 [Mycoplasmopsis bovis]|nr:hypothetical protein [Mycoplasmopsis bovis]QQH22999.1 hypothetical protein HYE28_01485 [Mycoplasmopsis bovis]